MRLEVSLHEAQILKRELEIRLKELSQEFVRTENRAFRRELKGYIEQLEILDHLIEHQIDLESLKYAI